MADRLSLSLQATGTISATAIQEALQRQVVFAGSVGTNLLEAGATTEPVLLDALGRAYGLPTVARDVVDAISPHIARLFPLPFAETYHLVPYQLDGDTLGVLINGEPDDKLYARIYERLKLRIAPAVTTEVRMHYAMNSLYGAELLPRFRTLLSHLDGTTVVTEPAAASLPRDVLSWGVSTPRVPASPGPKRRRLNLRGLLSQLEYADSREAIVDVLLETADAFFDFSALFLVQQDQVHGWRASSAETTQQIARISIPIEFPSVFQTIYVTRGHYLGPLPQNNVNKRFLGALGRAAPRAALIAPIVVGDRLALIFYADNGERGISPKRMAAMLLLTQRVGVAFERLIRVRKEAAAAPEPPPDPNPSESLEFRALDSGTTQQGISGDDFELLTESDYAELSGGEAEGATDNEADIEADIDIDEDIVVVDDDESEEDDREWSAVSFSDLDESASAATQAFEASLSASAAEAAEQPAQDDYVAFADVGESSAEALDDWEEVLVDTAESEPAAAPAAAPAAQGRPQASTITWQHVIAETQAAAKHVPRAAPTSFKIAGQIVDEREILLDSLVSRDPQARQNAVAKLVALGSDIDAQIGARFPGEIAFDPLDTRSRIPPFAQCSGVAEYLAARGAAAASLVLPHLESDDPVRRFFAIYFLLTIRCPEAIEVLARRLYDREPRNRHMATEALRSYSKEPAYSRVLEGTRGQLKVPVAESQIAAIQILGQLRDPGSVPLLIPLVMSPEGDIPRATTSALTVICGQGFGADVTLWADWWRRNFNKPRPAWLVEGLRSHDPNVRRVANHELQLVTGRTTHFDPQAADADREQATRMWEAWWTHMSDNAPQRAVPAGAASTPPQPEA